MKKLILFTFLIPIFVSSQINVNHTNLPDIGDTVITMSDYGSYTNGNSGANQFWDFSNAAGSMEMMLGFIDPVITPYQSSFPNSNLSVKVDSSMYFYLERSISGLKILGSVDSGYVEQFSQVVLPTPLNYLDTVIVNDTVFQFDTIVGPLPAIFVGIPGPYIIDSFKFTYEIIDTFVVDGWGQIQIPLGTYDALRVIQTRYGYENESYRIVDTINGASQWFVDTISTGIYWEGKRCSWRTNDSSVSWSIAEIELDSLGNSYGDIIYYAGNSINNIVISPAMVNVDKLVNVSCYGSSDGFIMLDILGTAYPFTFSWTGPNGYTSNSMDIYNLSPGMYEVTVTDSNGNITIEDFVITEPSQLNANILQSGLNLTVYANGGVQPYTYSWNNGDTTQMINVTSNGTYLCAIYDKNGCVYSVDFEVTNIPTNIMEENKENKIIKVINVLGQEIFDRKKEVTFYIYDNGKVEKKMIFD